MGARPPSVSELLEHLRVVDAVLLVVAGAIAAHAHSVVCSQSPARTPFRAPTACAVSVDIALPPPSSGSASEGSSASKAPRVDMSSSPVPALETGGGGGDSGGYVPTGATEKHVATVYSAKPSDLSVDWDCHHGCGDHAPCSVAQSQMSAGVGGSSAAAIAYIWHVGARRPGLLCCAA